MVPSSIIRIFFLIIMLVLGISSVFAQTGAPPSGAQTTKTVEETSSGYPVVLGDQTLFMVKDIKGLPAESRAKAFSDRLKTIAEDLSIRTDSIKISDYNHPLTLANADDLILFAVVDEDARLEGTSRHELAKKRAEIIRAAIERYRHDYGRKQLILGVVYSILATAVLLAILYLLVRTYRAILGRLDAWATLKIKKLHVESLPFTRAERVTTLLTGSLKVVRFVILAVILYSYVHLLLQLFPWTRPLAGELFDYIMMPLQVIGKALWRELPNFLFVVIIALFTLLVLKLMKSMFNGMQNETITIKGFYPEWSQPTYKIFRMLAIAFAAVVAFPYIPGSSSAAFKGVSIFLGVLFSLGSSSAVANILAGYSLIYRRVFKIGDRVKIADFVGDVVEMRLQVVSLRTVKNEVIVVPSSMIVNSHVINYSTLAKEKGLILHTKITIGYDAPWRQVEALLLMAAEKTPGLLREPAPFILQTSLDDFYVSYELNAYTGQPQEMTGVYAELHRNIQDVFNEYDVQIMSPSYRGDPAEPKVVPKDRWYASPAKKPDE